MFELGRQHALSGSGACPDRIKNADYQDGYVLGWYARNAGDASQDASK